MLGGQGSTLTSATSITITDSIHEVSGSAAIATINGGVAGQGLFLIRPTGATWTLTTGGNINATNTATDARYTLLITPDGSTWYGASGLDAAILTFTPYGHIAATTVQGAIQELVDEKTNTPNLTEDTSPDPAADFICMYDTSASAYKKVKPQNLGALAKTGGTMTGVILVGDGTVSAPSIALSGDTDTGLYGASGTAQIRLANNGADTFLVGTGAVQLATGHYLGWAPGATITATADIQVKRNAARRLDITADSTNAASVRILGNGTTATRYLSLSNDGTDGTISVPLGNIYIDAATNTQFKIGGTSEWTLTSSALAPTTTNADTLGTSSLLVKDAYVSTSIQGTRSKDLTEGNPTGFVRISVAQDSYVSGYVDYVIYARQNASNAQARAGVVHFVAINLAGTESVTLFRPDGQTTVDNTTDAVVVSGGTLTNTFTATGGTDAFDINANATSSLAQVTLLIQYRVVITSGVATVTPL